MSERVVAAWPEDAEPWEMHAFAHWYTRSWPAAPKSFAKAARLFGDEGNERSKATMLRNAQTAREIAEAEAKAAGEAEAARMAPIMAAREAAADAAMEALLAEEEQEKAAAPAKPRKVGRAGRAKK
jgi:hypothetical protein